MIEFVKQKIQVVAKSNPSIEVVLVVGSYGNNTQKETSDLDLIIISSDKEALIKNPNFIKEFGLLKLLKVKEYGVCTSFHTVDATGFKIEFGIVWSSWLHLPLDPGSHNVLKNGYLIIYDPENTMKGRMI